MAKRCPECEKKDAHIRELEGLVEMNRLEADQAVAERKKILGALIDMGLDGVLDRLEELGLGFGEDDDDDDETRDDDVGACSSS